MTPRDPCKRAALRGPLTSNTPTVNLQSPLQSRKTLSGSQSWATWREESNRLYEEFDEKDPVIRHFKIVKFTNRSNLAGWLDSLEEVINKTRREIYITPQDRRNLTGMLDNLNSMLLDRYRRTGRVEDLEEAINNAPTVPSANNLFNGKEKVLYLYAM
jgi:hypothetical protein